LRFESWFLSSEELSNWVFWLSCSQIYNWNLRARASQDSHATHVKSSTWLLPLQSDQECSWSLDLLPLIRARRIEKIHKSWDLAAQRKDGTLEDLDRSVSFGSISTTNVKKFLTDFKTKSCWKIEAIRSKLKINQRLKNKKEELDRRR
jgi:hypothetical protein